MSPSPCDCKLCAGQCVANTILPGLSWALVDTWSVCPSPDQPKSPRVSPARMQNVLPGSPASRSPPSCSALSCLSEPPRWTQDAGGAGGGQQLCPSPSPGGGNRSCRRLRAAELLTWVAARLAVRESSSEHGKSQQGTGTKTRSPQSSREGAQVTSWTRGSLETSPHCWGPEYQNRQSTHQAATGTGAAQSCHPCRGAGDSPPGAGHVLEALAEPPSWPSHTTQG